MGLCATQLKPKAKELQRTPQEFNTVYSFPSEFQKVKYFPWTIPEPCKWELAVSDLLKAHQPDKATIATRSKRCTSEWLGAVVIHMQMLVCMSRELQEIGSNDKKSPKEHLLAKGPVFNTCPMERCKPRPSTVPGKKELSYLPHLFSMSSNPGEEEGKHSEREIQPSHFLPPLASSTLQLGEGRHVTLKQDQNLDYDMHMQIISHHD